MLSSSRLQSVPENLMQGELACPDLSEARLAQVESYSDLLFGTVEPVVPAILHVHRFHGQVIVGGAARRVAHRFLELVGGGADRRRRLAGRQAAFTLGEQVVGVLVPVRRGRRGRSRLAQEPGNPGAGQP